MTLRRRPRRAVVQFRTPDGTPRAFSVPAAQARLAARALLEAAPDCAARVFY